MRDFFSKCISYWLFGILIILLGIDIALRISCEVITSDHIILVFIGILATFIVVSNYAQVKDIKESTNTEIREIKDAIYTKINTEINNHEKRIDALFKESKIDLKKFIQNESRRTKCLLYMQLSFAYSSGHVRNPDLAVYLLAYAIQEYKRFENDDNPVLKEIIIQTELLLNKSGVFEKSGINADNYFITMFESTIPKTGEIHTLLNDIWGITRNKPQSRQGIDKVVFVEGNIQIRRKAYYANVIAYCDDIDKILKEYNLTKDDVKIENIAGDLIIDDNYKGDGYGVIFIATRDIVQFEIYDTPDFPTIKEE
ncbi:MAG: hypothetical protein LBB84_03710 [Tannerellaceae bacterium]|jgi:hypothetical protein|nr:hypothetical protein [Tannerellaceae bacterium]